MIMSMVKRDAEPKSGRVASGWDYLAAIDAQTL